MILNRDLYQWFKSRWFKSANLVFHKGGVDAHALPITPCLNEDQYSTASPTFLIFLPNLFAFSLSFSPICHCPSWLLMINMLWHYFSDLFFFLKMFEVRSHQNVNFIKILKPNHTNNLKDTKAAWLTQLQWQTFLQAIVAPTPNTHAWWSPLKRYQYQGGTTRASWEFLLLCITPWEGGLSPNHMNTWPAAEENLDQFLGISRTSLLSIAT